MRSKISPSKSSPLYFSPPPSWPFRIGACLSIPTPNLGRFIASLKTPPPATPVTTAGPRNLEC